MAQPTSQPKVTTRVVTAFAELMSEGISYWNLDVAALCTRSGVSTSDFFARFASKWEVAQLAAHTNRTRLLTEARKLLDQQRQDQADALTPQQVIDGCADVYITLLHDPLFRAVRLGDPIHDRLLSGGDGPTNNETVVDDLRGVQHEYCGTPTDDDDARIDMLATVEGVDAVLVRAWPPGKPHAKPDPRLIAKGRAMATVTARAA